MKSCFWLCLFAPVAGNWVLPEDEYLYQELFHRATSGSEAETKVFDSIVSQFLRSFPLDTYANLVQVFDQGLNQYTQSRVFKNLVPNSAKCEKKSGRLVNRASKKSKARTFPGGIANRIFGFDFGKSAYDLLAQAPGPAGSSAVPVQMLTSAALSQAAGLVKTIISSVIHTLPPLVPPPAWINQPLPCVPLINGHNCAGAVLYPITAADFAISDVTDSTIDGYISSFPKIFYSKVGEAEELYVPCFSAYMSMHCASIFPICTTIFTREEAGPPGVGRGPMCFYHCILTLVMCPGFWLEDIAGACTNVGLPPMCSTAVFWNVALLPPQYTSHEDALPPPVSCPKTTFLLDSSDDVHLYDSLQSLETSPILSAGVESVPQSEAKF